MRYNGLLGGEVFSPGSKSIIIWILRASKNSFHCTKHNQHANARGSGPEKFEKLMFL